MNNRSAGIDALRIVGVLAVIAGHVWTKNDTLEAVIYPWHVPVFFFLTGYLWSSKRGIREEWATRKLSLAQPYVAWFAIIMVAFVGRQLLTGTLNPKGDLVQMYGGAAATRPFTTFWFVSALLATILLYRLISRLHLGLQWGIAGAGVALGVVAGGILAYTPLAVGAALPCLVFLVAGRTARLLRGRVRFGILAGTGMVVAAGVAVATGLSAVPTFKIGDYGTPVLSSVVAIVASFGLLLIFERLLSAAPPRAAATISSLAVPAIAVVLLHPVVLWLLHTPAEGRWVDFLLAVSIPWVVAMVAYRSPLALWLVGTRPAQAERVLANAR